jgi:hypothetical protein
MGGDISFTARKLTFPFTLEIQKVHLGSVILLPNGMRTFLSEGCHTKVVYKDLYLFNRKSVVQVLSQLSVSDVT